MMRLLLSVYKPVRVGLLCLVLLGSMSLTTLAQTPTDGLMMGKGLFCTGFMYTNDKWTDYWEGTLKRDNGNIGSITTQSLMYYGVYGITGKWNVIAMLPYMKTQASQGTLQGMEGLQDVSFGVKYDFLRLKSDHLTFRGFGVVMVSTPVSDYAPDYYPLALGTHSTNVNYRVNATLSLTQGWFVNGSAGYTWRSNTKLDRPAYHDGESFYNTDEVDLPNVFDLFVSAGYQKGAWQAEFNYILMNTLGGADIRRQDMPFVSNQMDAHRVGVLGMYYLPVPKNLAVRGSVHHTVAGRNVGKATTYVAGLLYTFNFGKAE